LIIHGARHYHRPGARIKRRNAAFSSFPFLPYIGSKEKIVPRLSWLALIPALAMMLGCVNPPPAVRPPVYLIVIDTLRVDALSCYGGKRPTPALDRFAASALVFDNCFAPSSWTVPSVASIWTGLYPFHHGTIRGLAVDGRVVSQQELSAGYTTIAEMFKSAGYATFGVSANGHIARKYGFAQGFDMFDNHSFADKTVVAKSWDRIARAVANAQTVEQPTFVMLFFFDPHHPYTPQKPYIDRYFPDWKKLGEPLVQKPLPDLVADGYFKQHPKAIEVARAMYDSEVASLDAYLGELLPTLPGYDEAWVLVLADHGESFGENGCLIHGNNLRQPEVHVPLLIKLPHDQYGGTRVAAPVSLVDVLPTLAALIEAPQPPKMDGVSLLPLLAVQPPPPRTLFLHIDLPWAHERAMVQWPFKIIRTADRPLVVFDLVADPAELRNLSPQNNDRLPGWERTLEQGARLIVHFPPRMIAGEMLAEGREQLKNLGYLQ
jgi:arylsulfatase A-like enzyme